MTGKHMFLSLSARPFGEGPRFFIGEVGARGEYCPSDSAWRHWGLVVSTTRSGFCSDAVITPHLAFLREPPRKMIYRLSIAVAATSSERNSQVLRRQKLR